MGSSTRPFKACLSPQLNRRLKQSLKVSRKHRRKVFIVAGVGVGA